MRLMILSQNKKKLIEVNKLDLRVHKDGGEYLIVIPASAALKLTEVLEYDTSKMSRQRKIL